MNSEQAIEPNAMNVLVADYDAGVRSLCRCTLEAAGYLVREALDGIDALRQVEQNEPDVVLIDLGLPRRSGLALLRHWRLEQRQLGVVVLTSQHNSDEAVFILEAGADDVVEKPFSPRLLVGRVSAVTRRLRGHARPAE